MDQHVCEECGEKIPASKRADAKFCSHTCRSSAEKRRHRERQRGEPVPRRGPYDTIPEMSKDRYRHARALGYRSGLEVQTARQLEEAGVEFLYEPFPIEYEVPARKAKYTCDFILFNGIVVETKGRWVTEDRKKIRLIKEQIPDLDLRIVFANSQTRISKQSKTTYAKICETIGIPFADKCIPDEWLKEPYSEARWEAIERFRWAGAKKRRAA